MVALIGFAGVVAGALVTGGVQWISAVSDRRLASRSSARQLIVLALRARAAVEGLAITKDWRGTDPEWEVFDRRWEEHGPNLARTVTTADFVVLAHFFQMVSKLGGVRTHQLARNINAVDPNQLRACQHILDMGENVNEILFAASQTRKESKAGDLPAIPELPEDSSP
jgi:hypothetical protein